MEMSQRMARANELQQRLGGPSPMGLGSPNLGSPNPNTPSLLAWASQGAGPQGPGAMPAHEDPEGLGLSTLHNLPPPPRSSPASQGLPGATSFSLGGGASG